MENKRWIPLLTSIGVGAATYYTMAKRKQKLSHAIQNIVPFVSSQLANSNANSSKNESNKLGQLSVK